MLKPLLATVCILLVVACHNNKSGKMENLSNETMVVKNEEYIPTIDSTSRQHVAVLDFKTIPETDKLTGAFPYIKLPIGYHFFENPQSSLGYGDTKNYDKEYFINHGTFFPEEGKTFKYGIGVDDGKTFSALELQKSFDDFMAYIGGVKLYDGEGLQQGEYDRLNQLENDAINSPYIFSIKDIIEGKYILTYIIKTKDKTVFIQTSIQNSVAYLTVLETKAFVNMMQQTSKAVIKNDIKKTGRAVSHFNFNTDKCALQPDDLKSVQEISKLLQGELSLNLSIDGHTDDKGEKAHNNKTIS